MRRAHSNEDSILRKIAAGAKPTPGKTLVRTPVLLGIGDDAALFQPRPGSEIVLTSDWFLEDTHFLREKHPPDSVGWKCLARAVSDIAAMGGFPRCFLLSLALPSALTGRWLDLFLRGLRRASCEFQCILAGGDTTRRDQILINVMVVGEVQKGCALLRSGARSGDLLYVSGHLGEAEYGLRLLKRGKVPASVKDPLTQKHLYPEPRLALGQWLASHRLATAVMDLSDGLSSDLPRLCAASGVGAHVEVAKLPTIQVPVRHLKDRSDPLKLALHGGDDYELLFTVRPKQARLLPRTFHGAPLTQIGIVTSKKQLVRVEEKGRKRPLRPGGWDPFGRRS